jgi:uncharacterized surface protein with fasciclin (FAS1) repeats
MKQHRLLTLLLLVAVLGLPLVAGALRAAAAPAHDSAVYNDATQARLRVQQCVLGGPDIDIYVNGQVAVNGGVPMAHLGALRWTGYLYLPPGRYSVALVPSGQGLDHAFAGPLEVTVAAGHRYTLLPLGQQEDTSHPALVVDETAAYQALGAKPTDAAHITVNNLKGVPGIDFAVSGVVRDRNAPYGGFAAAIWPAGVIHGLAITVSGTPDQVIDSSTDEFYNAPPGTDGLDCFTGHYPGHMGQEYNVDTSYSTSSLNTVDFLQLLNADAGNGGQGPAFTTFATALKTTGLSDTLATGGPYMIFPPTDEAFAALPAEQRTTLLNDPQALAGLLRGVIVPGYYPPGSLSGGTGGNVNRTVTNLLGRPLALRATDNGFTLNGVTVGDDGYIMTANGSRVFTGIKMVLPPGPAPGMPATGAPPAEWLAGLGAGLALLLAGGLLRRRPARLR